MMYASKIRVDKTPQKVTTTFIKSLGPDSCLTIAFLKDLGIGEHDEFSVYADENSGQMFISYDVTRFETPGEVEERVKRAIAYNKKYDEFHRNRS